MTQQVNEAKVLPLRLFECIPCKQAFTTRQQLANHRRTVGHQKRTTLEEHNLEPLPERRKRKLEDTENKVDEGSERETSKSPKSSSPSSPSSSQSTLPDTQPIPLDWSPIPEPPPKLSKPSRWEPVSDDPKDSMTQTQTQSGTTSPSLLKEPIVLPLKPVKQDSIQIPVKSVQPIIRPGKSEMIQRPIPMLQPTGRPIPVVQPTVRPLMSAPHTFPPSAVQVPTVEPVPIQDPRPPSPTPSTIATIPLPTKVPTRPNCMFDPKVTTLSSFPAHALIAYICPTCYTVARRPPLVIPSNTRIGVMSISVHTNCMLCNIKAYGAQLSDTPSGSNQ